jgi:hypothetical protein
VIPLLLAAAWASRVDPTALDQGWAAWSGAMASARYPFAFTGADFAALAKGQVVRRRVPADGVDRAVGAWWTTTPRDALWIAILDDQHDTVVSGLVERQLPGTLPERKLLYQHLDLPWPATDRHWVADIRNNRALVSASGGGVWERTWTLAAPALAEEAGAVVPGEAIWMPELEGGWTLAEVAGGTLLVYHVRTVIGGSIPDDLVARWSLSTLDGMLRHIDARARSLAAHYGPDHAPVLRPDGSAIPPF